MPLMVSFVALLRAVNVGGTNRLAMDDLKAICEAAGFQAVRTYIASGNVVFTTERDEPETKAVLEACLEAHAGKPVGVILRTAAEMAEVLARNPFAGAPGNRVMAIFLDDPTSPATLEGVTGLAPDEELRLGQREIYVRYGAGMANTKLRIPAAKAGTARNMNTVARLAAMAAGG
ncbi:MAG TPA: DUF1697 domain-containing protein [Acetobacteraceae bacterium]|nr:DUF1697 domain-containing protein [Acetobacteraceae bacterium]